MTLPFCWSGFFESTLLHRYRPLSSERGFFGVGCFFFFGVFFFLFCGGVLPFYPAFFFPLLSAIVSPLRGGQYFLTSHFPIALPACLNRILSPFLIGPVEFFFATSPAFISSRTTRYFTSFVRFGFARLSLKSPRRFFTYDSFFS